MDRAIPTSEVIAEHIWRPLVHVSPQHKGLLVHPGMPKMTVGLAFGWKWHWPWLTSIIILSGKSYAYVVREGIAPHNNLFADEPIVAVSKDHRLVKFEATVRLRIDTDAGETELGGINGRFVTTILRPKIRQAFRESSAAFLAGDILRSPDEDAILHALRRLTGTYPIEIQSVRIEHVFPFAPYAPAAVPA